MHLRFGLFFTVIIISCFSQQVVSQMRVPSVIEPEIVGNCFIYHLREMDQYAPIGNLQQVCSSPKGWSPATHAYVFAFTAINSFYNAEYASCGSYGCTSIGKDMRIVLVGDPIPRAYIATSEGVPAVTLVITTSLVDFVQRNGHALMNDLLEDPKLAPEGLDAWLMDLFALGGKSCSLPLRWNTTSLSPKIGEQTVLQLAGITYQFLFAHEIAHLQTNRTCGYKNDPARSSEMNSQGVEMACDKIAFENLAKAELAMPLFTVATFIGWEHYISLKKPKLMAEFPGGSLEFREAFPALGLKERSRKLVAAWERACSDGRASVMCIRREELLEKARSIINTPAPCECVP